MSGKSFAEQEYHKYLI